MEELKLLMAEHELGDAALAAKMKMDRTTVFRARNGNPVGEQFITGLLSVFREKRFEDLFFVRDVLRGNKAT